MKNTRLWIRLAACASLCTIGLLVIGCAAAKTVDSTIAIQAMTAGEQHVTYTPLPGSLVGQEYDGKTFWFPTVPGKNLEFTKYFENGQVEMKLATARSPVLDALYAGANAADAQKFAQDQWQAQYWGQFARDMIATALSLRATMAAESAAEMPASQPTGQFQAELKQLLLQWLKEQAATPS